MTAPSTASPQTDFLTVALAAWHRGFHWLTPVDDKKALREKWHKFNRTETLTNLRDVADDFPNASVGIVMRHGIGNPFVIDIDKDTDVIGRLEREKCETLPSTYQVQTRPDTKPYKMHLFFYQTEHSCLLLTKQVTDVTAYTGYDLKGCGGAGYVVAEGCQRADTGEIRKGNGKEIVPVPSWLVDWLVTDIKKAKAKKGEALRRAAEERRKEQEKRIEDAKALTESGEAMSLWPEVQLVPVGQRHGFLWSMAGTLVRRGMDREVVFKTLLMDCETRCEGGVAFTESEDGKRKIHDIAHSKKLKTGGIIPSLLREKKEPSGVIKRPPESEWERLLKIAKELPNPITSVEMYGKLGLDRSSPKDRKTASRVMDEAGFLADRGRRAALWRRRTGNREQDAV
jgi:hypothetical protein